VPESWNPTVTEAGGFVPMQAQEWNRNLPPGEPGASLVLWMASTET
jgi:hypothetical protein